jgi:DNA-binding transcriptional LysR family regulator
VVDHGLSVSKRPGAVHVTTGHQQAGPQLGDKLGLHVFVRQGKRLSSLTPAGEIVVATARRALREINNMKRVADECRSEDAGTLAIATTPRRRATCRKHLGVRRQFPKVRVVLHQGAGQVAEQTAASEADIGIATEPLSDYPTSSRFRAIGGIAA